MNVPIPIYPMRYTRTDRTGSVERRRGRRAWENDVGTHELPIREYPLGGPAVNRGKKTGKSVPLNYDKYDPRIISIHLLIFSRSL